MAYKLFGIPNCNTVKKAQTWLDDHNVVFEFHNYKKQGLTQDQWNSWLSQAPIERLVNKAGMTYRKLDDASKEAVLKAPTSGQIVLENTSIIKRPIVEKDGKIVAIGFKESEYEQTF